MQRNVEKKDSITSAVITVVLVILLLIVSAFVGLNPPDPPIPEEGVEVNLGDSDFGLGNAETPEASEQMSAPKPPSSTGEDVSTQRSEETVSLNRSSNNSSAETSPVVEDNTETTKEPVIDNRALFPGNRTKTDGGGSQGITQGQGNQGKQGGDPNSQRYDGAPGRGGSGWSLSGRRASSFPLPQYDSNKEGKIIVKIWVDRSGTVVRVEGPERGSNITEQGMVAKAKSAAMNAKFNADNNASELQVGTITYVFRRSN
ncbi:MAG: hypothetical protein IJV22_00930 [Bacteroidales bacterium]|nr:hypothetical protein [Bacteroidales bacterium]